MTYWITGAKGFIGRSLAAHLAGKQVPVLGLGHGAWDERSARLHGLSFWLNGEINGSNLRLLLRKSGEPRVIFHLAGGSSVGLSCQSPLEDFQRTVDTTARLLEWIRHESPGSRLVCASSAAVYGDAYAQPIPEEAPLSPYSPYGSHKAMMETLCQSYGRNFGISVALVRLFSVYGPGLEKQLIWDVCSRLAGGSQKLTLGGNGQELRDWLHVDDAATLLEMAAQRTEERCMILNGGTGIGTSVNDIVRMIVQEWGSRVSVEFSGSKRLGDPDRLVAETARSRKFGFMPSVRLDQGISNTVAWYRRRLEA